MQNEIVLKLRQLKELHDNGLINDEEYAAEKTKVLNESEVPSIDKENQNHTTSKRINNPNNKKSLIFIFIIIATLLAIVAAVIVFRPYDTTQESNELSSLESEETEIIPTDMEAIDLGLSVLWASSNLGATIPEHCGYYYSWGETAIKSDYSFDYNELELSVKKYSNNVDNKTVLKPEDDVATVKLGKRWRMPTDPEMAELIEKCIWSWTTLNGMNGFRITSKVNKKEIFLPAAGYRNYTEVNGVGVEGAYWTSSPNTGTWGDAWALDFDEEKVIRRNLSRSSGFTIRPVMDK